MARTVRFEGMSGGARGAGGITGPGGVNVNPVYKNQVDYVKPIPKGAPPKKISSSVTIKAPKK